MMSRPEKYPNSMQDDRLAEFTDQALTGRIKQAESSADEELIALEETVLRLKQAFPPVTLDQPAIKKMQVRFNARVKRETQEVKQPFWKKWFDPHTRLQFGMAFAAVAMLIMFAVFAPSPTTGSTTSGTAFTPAGNTLMVVALAGVVLIFLWTRRRK